jgi:hypothetical protein
MHIAAIIAGVLSVLVTIWLTARRYEKNRTAELQTVADEMGILFTPHGDPSLQQSLRALPLFNQGRGRKIKNLMRGTTEELDLAIFGYQFTTGHGKHQTTHTQTVVSFQSPQLSLPDFTLSPENLFHKIGQKMGYQDIDFESHPKFSADYLLRGSNESRIRELMRPEILDYLESQQKLCVQASANRLIVFRSRKRVKAAEIRDFMEDGFGIYRLLSVTV